MTTRISKQLLLLWALVAAQVVAAPQAVTAEQFLDRVIASVGGEPVTFLELQRFLKTIGAPQADSLKIGTGEYQKSLSEFLLNRMMEREAEDAGISVGEDEIQAYMAEIRRQNSVDDEGFADLLRSKGLTREQYVAQIRGDILKSRVVSARVRNQVNVVDEDIARYVEEHPELRPSADSIHVEQVRVPVAGDPAQAKEKAEKLREQLADGTDLEDLEGIAKSDSGEPAPRGPGDASSQDLGFVNLEDLRSEIAGAVKKLEAEEVSKVEQIGSAYYVFRVVEKAGEKPAIDASTRERIREQIFQQKFEQRLKAFLDEELPKKYQVELVSAKS